MRKLASFTQKYGPLVGPRLLSALQKEAAHARWKEFYRRRSQSRPSPDAVQTRGQEAR